VSRILLGITGAPGSGKSTYADAEHARLLATGTSSVVVPMDGFHLPQAELVRLGRADVAQVAVRVTDDDRDRPVGDCLFYL